MLLSSQVEMPGCFYAENLLEAGGLQNEPMVLFKIPHTQYMILQNAEYQNFGDILRMLFAFSGYIAVDDNMYKPTKIPKLVGILFLNL